MAKAVISSTYDDNYFYFIPLVAWLWNRLGVDVICFVPEHSGRYFKGTSEQIEERKKRYYFITQFCEQHGLNVNFYKFKSPEHKEATYAQCSRLYGACLDLPEDEVLITSDVDMGVFLLSMATFKFNPYQNNLTVFGSDLVPEGQFPMCYATGTVKEWRIAMKLDNKTYQQCLDELLGEIECDHMRGNYWGKDQQTLWENIKDNATLIPRARPGTQFAANRVDRDDINWRAYVNDDLVDAHLWRPGYTDENFANIMELLTMKYPNEDFTWLRTYTEQYKKIL